MNSKRIALVACLAMLCLAVAPGYALLTDYAYYQQLTFTGSLANTSMLTIDTQSLNASGHLRGDCFDMNFTTSSDAAINFWIENCSMTAGVNSTVGLNVTGLGTNFVVNMYYGNSSKSVSPSNIYKVFKTGEDFNASVVNNTRWANVTPSEVSFTIIGNQILNVSGNLTAERLAGMFMPMSGYGNNYTLVYKQKASTPWGSYRQAGFGFGNQTGTLCDSQANCLVSYFENWSAVSKDYLLQVSGRDAGVLIDRAITSAATTDTNWHTYYIRRDGNVFNFSVDSTNIGSYTHSKINTNPYVVLDIDFRPVTNGYYEAQYDYVYVKDNNPATYTITGEMQTLQPTISYPTNTSYYSFPSYYQFTTPFINQTCYHIRNTAQFNFSNGLVGRWYMDMGGHNQTNISDSSGLGNHGNYTGETFNNGTLYNMPNVSWTTGKYGGGLNFSGNGSGTSYDGYFQATLGNITANQFTLSGWVSIRHLNVSNNPIFVLGTTVDAAVIYVTNAGLFRTYVVNSSASTLAAGSYPTTNNTWYYLTTTYNGSGIEFFVNGIPNGNTSVVGGLRNTSQFRIAKQWSNPALYFNGTIDSVRIWNTTLNASQIVQEMNSPYAVNGYGLVGAWEFEEAAGNQTKDTHNFVAGQVGTALNFNGVGDYVSINNTLPVNGSFSVSLWTKINSFTTNNRIITKTNSFSGNVTHFAIFIPSSGTIRTDIGNDAAGESRMDSTGWVSDTWNNYVLSYDNITRNGTVYKNGVISATKTFTVLPNASTSNIVLGSDFDLGQYFNGSIDDVMIFNRSLSAAEISEYFNATSNQYNISNSTLTTKTFQYINSTQNSIEVNCLNILAPYNKTVTTSYYSVLNMTVAALNKSNSYPIENYTVTIYNATNSYTVNSWLDGDGNNSLATFLPEQHVGGLVSVIITSNGYVSYYNSTSMSELTSSYTAYMQRSGVDLWLNDESTGNLTQANITSILIYNSTNSLNFTGNNFSWNYFDIPGGNITIVATYQNVTVRQNVMNTNSSYNNITLTFQQNVILFAFYVYDTYNVPVNGSLLSFYSSGGVLLTQGYTQQDGYLTDVYLSNQIPVYIYLSKTGMYNTSTYFIPSPNIVQPFRLRMDYIGTVPLPNQSSEITCSYNPVALLVGYNTTPTLSVYDPLGLINSANLSIYRVNYSGSYAMYSQDCSNASSCIFSYKLSNATTKYVFIVNATRNGTAFICSREYVTNASTSSLFTNNDLPSSTGMSKEELKFIWFIAAIFLTGLAYRFIGPGALMLIPILIGYGWICNVYSFGELIVISILTLAIMIGVM